MPEDVVTLQLPRSALTIVERPRCVSQRTSERVLGIPRRPFLELVREYAVAGGAVTAPGRLRIVDVDAFVAWLGKAHPVAPADAGGVDAMVAAALRKAR